jgi:hypothetical protein
MLAPFELFEFILLLLVLLLSSIAILDVAVIIELVGFVSELLVLVEEVSVVDDPKR